MAGPLSHPDVFSTRHIGPDAEEQKDMLRQLGLGTLDELVEKTVPKAIRLARPLDLPPAISEAELLERAHALAAKNKIHRSFIGTGYSDCVTPPVILRNILENPGWYTAYTPYQAEVAQGRLEALLNYQTMVEDLTALPVANASLLDEGTAAAEAMTMLRAVHGGKGGAKAFFVSEACHPQTIDVVRTRAKPLGIEILVGDHRTFDVAKSGVYGALVQYPATDGAIHDYRAFIKSVHDAGGYVAMAADLLSLALLVPPGELGADVALGSSQRFGVPLGYGGPHAAYFATKQEFVRSMPGRIIGVSQDAQGNTALRMALGTREQHIRREKATSNICTAQVLLAVIAGSYAVYHGPKGIRAIAERVQTLTGLLAKGLERSGFKTAYDSWFDTVRVDTSPEEARRALAAAETKAIGFRRIGERAIGISLDETTSLDDVNDILGCFREGRSADPQGAKGAGIPKGLERTSAYLTHPVFSMHHSETEMLRYLKQLENKDLSLVHSMIPLGSCTMKLNATAEMIPVTMPGFGKIHPFAPRAQAEGYKVMFEELEKALAEITGFPGISLQPNAGSQGEYAGLLVIRRYQEAKGQGHRNVCLIPESAHGTNPASAAMAGLKVVVTKCDENGNIDLGDLEAKAKEHAKDLCCLMVTYPSTHGVFEEDIKKICSIVHEFGGQVYMDGANMNAQVGLTRPGDIGADVCHLNLHKTFCLAAGTQVTVADGTTRPIEELVAGMSVLAWSEKEGGVRAEALQAAFHTGRKECVEVLLQDGRKITCTPDHRVLTTDGWVEASDLTPMHRVVVGPEAPIDDATADLENERTFVFDLGGIRLTMDGRAEREKTLAFFRLLGALLSDGSFSREKTGRQAGRLALRLNFGTALDAERALDDIERLAGIRPSISRANGLFSLKMPQALSRAIESVPGIGETGKRVTSDRILPDFVDDLATPVAVLREFLAALFGGDGCAPLIVHLTKNPSTLKPVRFVQTRSNPRIAEALQLQICRALGRLGILATPEKLERRADKLGGDKLAGAPRWMGIVTVVDSLRFAERVGFRYCSHKTTRLSAAAAFWRLKATIHEQRLQVAERALANVKASGIVRLGPKSVWRAAVDRAYREVSAEQFIVNPYYASFEGSDRLSKQHLEMSLSGAKGRRKGIRGLRRTNRRVLVAPVARGGARTGMPTVAEFFDEIGASSWFNAHHPQGTRYSPAYATSQDATVEPTMTLKVLDVRSVGEREVYDLTVNDLHSFLANGAVVHNCIPHGGGGPGMGPIGVAAHLAKYLPKHPVVAGVGGDDGIGAISAAPWGSASILLISWAYIRMMGGAALADATRVAILNANYIAKRLEAHYPVLYKGKSGMVAHECILDLRPLKKTSGVEAEDVAKRLMDYGFHAPTLSFPVAGTLMIEPTESEPKAELDRFCDAMIAIRNEIREVEEGKQPREGNVLKNAPHTAASVIADEWTHPYSRTKAAFPAPWSKANKFWPSVRRVNNAFGDRNLVCACPPIEAYAEPKRASG